MTTATRLVKVNTAAMTQPFHPCDPDFIRNVCQARCCRSTTDALRQLGATVDPDTGRVAPVNRRCPFQDADTHLCTIHATDQPAGCAISPFTINTTGTLIVRNRYRRLPCFKAPGAVAVVHAHRRSLEAIFGPTEAARIVRHVDDGTGAVLNLAVAADIIAMLHHKNTASKTGARTPLTPSPI